MSPLYDMDPDRHVAFGWDEPTEEPAVRHEAAIEWYPRRLRFLAFCRTCDRSSSYLERYELANQWVESHEAWAR